MSINYYLLTRQSLMLKLEPGSPQCHQRIRNEQVESHWRESRQACQGSETAILGPQEINFAVLTFICRHASNMLKSILQVVYSLDHPAENVGNGPSSSDHTPTPSFISPRTLITLQTESHIFRILSLLATHRSSFDHTSSSS